MITAIYYPTDNNPHYRVCEHDCRPRVWRKSPYKGPKRNSYVEYLKGIFSCNPHHESQDYGPQTPLDLEDDVLDYIPHQPRTIADIQTPFVWRTHKGSEMVPADMATPHLFYTIRMLFNNVVTADYRVGGFKSYPEIDSWSPEYIYQALYELNQELQTRDDLDFGLACQYAGITLNSAELAEEGYWYEFLNS
jgi:hypothetical protein